MLIASLPLLYPFYRVGQSQDVKEQAIPDPEEQHYLHRDEQRQRPTEPEGGGNGKPPLDMSTASAPASRR